MVATPDWSSEAPGPAGTESKCASITTALPGPGATTATMSVTVAHATKE